MIGLTPDHPIYKARAARETAVTGIPATAEEMVAREQASAFNAAASDFQNKFLDGLNLSAIELGDLWLKQTTGLLGKSIQEVLSTRSPEEVLDAIAKADPTTKGAIDAIKEHPDFAKSLHTALVKDPTMLGGLAGIANAKDGDFNLTDLQKILNDPRQRDIMKQVLDKVAEGQDIKGNDIDFSHVRKLLSQHKQGDQAAMLLTLKEMKIAPPLITGEEFGEFMEEFMKNPEKAINDLVNLGVANGTIDPQMANMIKGFMGPLGEIMKFMFEPSYDLAVAYDLGVDTPQRMMEAAEVRGLKMGNEHGHPLGVKVDTTTDFKTLHKKTADAAGHIDREHVETALNDAAKGNTELTGSEVVVASLDQSILKGTAYDEASLGIVNGGEAAADMENDMGSKLGNNNRLLTNTMTG